MAKAWQRQTPVREAADAAQKRARVLVVAADASDRRALTLLLAGEGLAVVSVATGAEAPSELADRAPDLVVLEVGAAPAAGVELCSG